MRRIFLLYDNYYKTSLQERIDGLNFDKETNMYSI